MFEPSKIIEEPKRSSIQSGSTVKAFKPNTNVNIEPIPIVPARSIYNQISSKSPTANSNIAVNPLPYKSQEHARNRVVSSGSQANGSPN